MSPIHTAPALPLSNQERQLLADFATQDTPVNNRILAQAFPRIQATIDSAYSLLDLQTALLRSLEWLHEDGRGSRCPICKADQLPLGDREVLSESFFVSGHLPYCSLAAALQSAELAKLHRRAVDPEPEYDLTGETLTISRL